MRLPPLGPRYTIRPGAPLWPAPLCDLADAPAQLEVVGELPPFSEAVAVVGTRHPSAPGADFARRLARELAEAGWVVISGGAQGIDSEAHQGALEAGGRTLAVLGTPLDRPYPAANMELFRQIASAGCVLSELETGAPMYRSRFLQRNRLIAALARVVVVVQAPFASGALSTAAEAKALGRTLLAVPHAPWDERGLGCLGLLADGAGVCRSSRDVLSLAAASPQKRLARTRKTTLRRPDKVQELHGLDEDERSVAGALLQGSLTADELCEASGLPAPRVQRAILMLLLSKVIQEVGSGRYVRCDYR